MNPVMARALVAVLVPLLTACATTGSVASESETAGRLLQFPEPCAVLVELVPPTRSTLGFAIDVSKPAEPCGLTVVAVKSVSFASWGEIVSVIVAPADSGGAVVRMHTRRRLATNVTAIGDWSKRIYQALLEALEARAVG